MLFIQQLFENPDYYMQTILIVMFSVCCHEYAHARVALWQGDDTAARAGHLTLNPIKQMGIASIIMLAFLGLAWGAVPVNPRNFKNKYSDFLISFAGPAMNLILMLLFSIGAGIILNQYGHSYNGIAKFNESLHKNAFSMLQLGGIFNFILFILNMMPINGFDGGKVFAALFPKVFYNNSEFTKGLSLFAFLGFIMFISFFYKIGAIIVVLIINLINIIF